MSLETVKAALARRLFLQAAPREPRLDALIAPREGNDPLGEHPGTSALPWEEAALLARRVNQEPLFLHFISRVFPEAAVLPETRKDLESQTRFHAFRWIEIRESAEAALSALAGKGIRPVLLKGLAYVREYYDPPHLRPMRDLDLLVKEGEVPEAHRALIQAGFKEGGSSEEQAFYAGHHHLPPLFHGSTGMCLELHHHLMKLPAYYVGFPPLDDFWKDARESSAFPGKALLLDPTLEVLNTCIHVTHGDAIGGRAQNLIDLARIVEAHGDRIDWDRLARYAASPCVASSLAVPLEYLAREGLPAPSPPVRTRFIELSRLKRWELRLLFALTSRYRLKSPGAWRLVSPRMANVLWRQAFRRAGTLRRLGAVVTAAIAGRRKKRGN